ncbi:MAG: 2-phospho-L-lactate transferase [Chloroflexi bacterium]|nr:2-phospho-L-lactate transferase [Chloroflexota bacterium]
MSIRERVTLLVGGVGGAKLALGLADVLPAGALTVIVNTADDFRHLGLHVSPDLDTVMYTLADMANPKRGWGIAGDSLKAMSLVERYGGPSWFSLGDTDLGTNIYRTALLDEGHTLTAITERFSKALGIEHTILPMTDDRVRTLIDTVDMGTLGFQDYFVRERWQPVVTGIRFEGAAEARPTEAVLQAMAESEVIILGPSNPLLSIDPILSVPGIRDASVASKAPVVGVSPIVNGQAIKGPAAKLMAELKLDVSPVGVLRHYDSLLDGFILDERDSALLDAVHNMGVQAAARQTVMQTRPDKVRLANEILDWIEGSDL